MEWFCNCISNAVLTMIFLIQSAITKRFLRTGAIKASVFVYVYNSFENIFDLLVCDTNRKQFLHLNIT